VKKWRFYGQKPTLWPKIFAKMATTFDVNTLKICSLAKNPLFYLTYLKNEKNIYSNREKKTGFWPQRVFCSNWPRGPPLSPCKRITKTI
jgi:hypothetical protein